VTAPVAATTRGFGLLAAFVAVAVAAGVGDWFGLVPILVAIGTTILVAPVVAMHRARRAGTVRVSLEPDRPVAPVGADVAVAVRVAGAAPGVPVGIHRRWRRARRPVAHFPAAGRVLLAPGIGSVVPLPPSGPARWPVPTDRRGIVVLPPSRVWVHDPLGLFGAVVGQAGPATVVVHPVPGPAPALPPPPPAWSHPPAPQVSAVTAPARTADGTGDLAGLRTYVPGDRLHRLHWPSLALYDALLVRHFDPETPATAIRLVVDDRTGVHRPAAFDAVLSAALALADEAADGHVPAELATLSGLIVTVGPGDGGRMAARSFLAPLFPVHPAPGRPPTDGVILTTPTGATRLPPALATRAVVIG